MVLSIKEYLEKSSIDGEILLYRDSTHKKKSLCEYLANNITTNKVICTFSVGAFGLYLAKSFPNNIVIICTCKLSEEYKQQIIKLPNVIINNDVRSIKACEDYAKENDYFFINQYNENLISDYYALHFQNILKENNFSKIDAFCDCGHTCATITGFIKSKLVNWQFILGVNNPIKRENVYHLNDFKSNVLQEYTGNFNTKQIQEEIESIYPDFGNIFEATRSISAAMSWLQKNPGKTVLVYVGDSPAFGEDTEI